MSDPVFAVIGATGVVGKQVIAALLAHNVEPDDVRFLASERSAGEELDYGEEPLPVEPIGPDAFRGVTAANIATPVADAKALATRHTFKNFKFENRTTIVNFYNFCVFQNFLTQKLKSKVKIKNRKSKVKIKNRKSKVKIKSSSKKLVN